MRLCWPNFVLVFLTFSTATYAQSPPQPPVAAQVEHISVWHGEKVNDPFFWLREKRNPAVIKYLEAENAYTESLTKGLNPFADALYQEMLGHIKQTDSNVPVRRGDYFYYARTEEGKQYPIRCRKKASAGGPFGGNGPEEVLLDANELAKGLKFLSVGAFEVSDDTHLLAYSVDTTGFRQYRLYVKDLRTGTTLPDTAERVTSVQWCADNRTLFYTTEDPVTKRSNLVWRHSLGDENEPVYQEKDRLFSVRLGESKDRKMLFLQMTSTDTHERTGRNCSLTGRTSSCRASSCSRTTSWRPKNPRHSPISAYLISAAEPGTKSAFRKASTPPARARPLNSAPGVFGSRTKA
jgi:oligopeptidase B